MTETIDTWCRTASIVSWEITPPSVLLQSRARGEGRSEDLEIKE